MSKAKRYNKGKLRYELVPTNALDKLVEVYTKGAHKYSVYENVDGKHIKGIDIPFEQISQMNLKLIEDGANNWRLGQRWTESMASVERHIADWKKGIDIDNDPSMGTYHLANAAWGLMSLLEYYKIYPEGDDRNPGQFYLPKIGLDIDEVLAGFSEHFFDYLGLDSKPAKHWNDPRFRNDKYWEAVNNEQFWTTIPPLIHGDDLPFEPHCYITARSANQEWTQKWLDMYGFPRAPLYTVPLGESKVDAAKKAGVEVFVDDSYENYVDMNANGIFTYLMTRSHNEKYNVGHRRINSLKDIKI